MPVLPDVPSMIVPPGFSSPARSASSIIFTAIRSLIELPGLNVSILAKTVACTTPFVIELICTIGVSPIASRIVAAIFLTDLVYVIWRSGGSYFNSARAKALSISASDGGCRTFRAAKS